MTQEALIAVIGYARTSTRDQEAGFEAQKAELRAAGCEKVFGEQVSGVDAGRPQLKAALEYLREGDTFVATRPDRLARSTSHLLKIVETLTAEGVRVRILSMDMDTATPTGKLILTVLAGVGQFEREIMLERQRDGIAKAKSEGKYTGRQPTAQKRAAEIHKLKAEGRGPVEITKLTGLSRSSVQRILRAA